MERTQQLTTGDVKKPEKGWEKQQVPTYHCYLADICADKENEIYD